jgi:hypothetical protein
LVIGIPPPNPQDVRSLLNEREIVCRRSGDQTQSGSLAEKARADLAAMKR